jgi:hypothetical protein
MKMLGCTGDVRPLQNSVFIRYANMGEGGSFVPRFHYNAAFF